MLRRCDSCKTQEDAFLAKTSLWGLFTRLHHQLRKKMRHLDQEERCSIMTREEFEIRQDLKENVVANRVDFIHG